MIYTLTFNPALDYILYVENLQTKDINRAIAEKINYGGKGVNVSYILSQLGVDSVALGFVAGFSGNQLEDMLRQDSIATDFVHLSKGNTRINVKIRSGEELDINADGPEISQENVDELIKKLDKIKSGDILVLAGSVPKGLDDSIYSRIMKGLCDREVRFIVDATGELLLNSLEYKPFMIKPNHHELGELFSTEIETLEDIEKYAKLLQEKGAVNVLVSRGKDGAVLVDENGAVHCCANVDGKIASSVGCGDSMVAGFIAGYEKSGDYDYALRLGSACGNATAFTDFLASGKEIDEMFEKFFN